MLSRLASFLYAHRRRVLITAVIGAAVAAAFGAGVASRLSPYSAEDPATQSVQATHRYEHAAGRQIEPGIVALLSTTSPKRVAHVAATLQAQPDVAAVVHDPSAVSRDGHQTYLVAYFKPLSDSRIKDDAQ